MLIMIGDTITIVGKETRAGYGIFFHNAYESKAYDRTVVKAINQKGLEVTFYVSNQIICTHRMVLNEKAINWDDPFVMYSISGNGRRIVKGRKSEYESGNYYIEDDENDDEFDAIE
jgi:hypothetical protein